MKRIDAIAALLAHEVELRAMGVVSLALFGSVVRDEARPDSDVDLLVDLSDQVGLFELVALQDRLSEILGGPVDVVPRRALKARLRPRVLAEAVTVLVA